MVELDSPRWGTLRQAFGTAEDIPKLLSLLETVDDGVRQEIWLGLWGTLCPEGEVYSASYAAVPHLVEYARRRPAARGAEAVHLVGAIEVGRLGVGAPEVPDDLVAGYRAAVAELPALIAGWVGEPWDGDTTQVLSAALAIAKGHPRFGAAALLLEPSVVCPVCGASHPPAGWDLGQGA